MLKMAGFQMAKGQEGISASLVSSAVLVAERLRTDRITKVITDLEELFGSKSALNSISKLTALATKPAAKTRAWVFEQLHDWIIREQILNADVTKTTLAGDKNACGLIALFEIKLSCLELWNHTIMPRTLQGAESDRATIRENMATHAKYREKGLGPEVQWQGQLAESSLAAWRFLEAGREEGG